jgi:GDP-mannose 6-dehydrogenase
MLGIDSHEVMDIFCQDNKLNLSPYYMRPGFAFGGSCLPKDLRAIVYSARHMDLDIPILNSVLDSNQMQVRRGLDMIMATGANRIGILGLAFKAGTDDLRESPMVEVSEFLIGKGYDLRVYDRNVNLARLTGANQEYISVHIPHLARLMTQDMNEVLTHGEVIVIGNKAEEFRGILPRLRPDQKLIDFVRINKNLVSGQNYQGICW